MKKLLTLIFVAAIAAGLGWYFGRSSTETGGETTSGDRKIAFYQSPMHPWIKSDQPGNCTICGMKLTPVYEGEKGFDSDSSVVALSSNAINTVNVQTEQVQVRPLQRTIEVAGTIVSDRTRNRVISAYVDGRVEKLFVNYVGAEVKEGEPLATLYSPNLLTAEREYSTLLAQTNLASSPQLRAEHERLVQAAAQRLQRLGMSAAQISELAHKAGTNFTTQVVSPISGTVINRAVFEGQYVKEGDKLFEISDLGKMWFIFDVYEQDLAWIQPGQQVQVSSSAIPGKTFEGPITFIDPTINETTRSAKVRVELVNPLVEANGAQRRELLNNLYARGKIQIQSEPFLAVSRTAVLNPGDGPRVWVDEGGGAYQARPVTLGWNGAGFVQVIEGLAEGERVVTTGNFLIDSQAQISGGGAGAGHQHGTESPAHEHRSGEQDNDNHSAHEVTEKQAQAAKELITTSDLVNQGLAADRIKEFNEHLAHLRDAATKVEKQFSGVPDLGELAANVSKEGKLGATENLDQARKTYMAFSKAVADFASALKNTDPQFPGKVYKCPMYPAPGKTAFWVQSDGPIRNPFYGSEMLDCGTEVK